MPQPPFELEEATIADLQQRIATGRDTARSLAEKYLARIEAVDRRGPATRSVIEINPDAAADAERLDAEHARGAPRGPLHGIPMLIKDNFATADRMMTTAGSLALVGARPPADAFVVRRLRAAGVVLLGKTNMSEWAEFRSVHCCAGWSGRGGQTRNPYALDRSPMGSSSGSAVAVAANLCAVALGTETDGSIVLPANNNSVVGLKPTLGLASRHGIVPVSHNQDTPGVLARTVRDAAIILGVIAGRDRADPATRAIPRRRHDFTASLDRRGLKSARIGVVRSQLFGNSVAADRAADAALAVIKDEGAVLVDPANFATLWKFDDTELEVLACDFKADLRRFLAWIGASAKVRSLEDVIAFNTTHAASEMPYFGQELMTMAERKGPVTSKAYRAALAANHRLTRTLGIDAVVKKHRLDALVAPTGGPPALIDLVNGDGGTWAVSSPATIAAVAGYPHISVPMGYARGLPMGISFFGRAWSEPTLIRLAYAYEQATTHRRSPTFAPTADVTL
ncbi:MAG TPA: amidase [Vicinamibacterales bacterium]|nr:amidase [Vicinamibacterales bacterium]